MPQDLLTIDQITLKAQSMLENELVLSGNVNKQYNPEFAKTGAKIGDVLRIRNPDRVLVTKGAALQVQEVHQRSTPLAVANQMQVAVEFGLAEQALSLDEYAELVLQPRISQMAATFDAELAVAAYQAAYFSVGTPGTTPATSQVLLAAQQKLDEAAISRSNRFAVVDPAANAGLVEGMKGFFNPSATISNQFKSGLMGTGVLGYKEISMSQSITTHLNGDWGTTITSTGAVVTQGQSTLPISFTGTSKTWRKGDVFTVANVFSVNPQTRKSTGSLQEFVVQADVTGTSTATLSVSPPMYTADHPLATISAFPQATAVVTMRGSTNVAYPQNLVYDKDSIAMVTVDPAMPEGGAMVSRKQYKGISMTVVKDFDITNYRNICRIDIIYGFAVIRPEGVVRLWG